MSGEIQTWAERLEDAIASRRITLIDRGLVPAETPCTQDAALAMSGGRPGLLVLAGRQTRGRGRLGRTWDDAAGAGLAATFVLEPREPGMLALGAGLAACRAAGSHCTVPLGLRWPNDVVEAVPPGRKVAGVLIEAKEGLALVGIGVNVRQDPADWPESLRASAVSLRMLGSSASRSDVAEAMVNELDRVLAMPPDALAAEWARRDVVVGTRREFECDGRRVRGIDEAISPSAFIQVRADDGTAVRLPALTTSLIKE